MNTTETLFIKNTGPLLGNKFWSEDNGLVDVQLLTKLAAKLIHRYMQMGGAPLYLPRQKPTGFMAAQGLTFVTITSFHAVPTLN